MPVYAAREDITVTDNKGNRIANDTIDMESDYNVYGANKVVNETFEDDVLIPEQDRYFELAITAKSPNNAVASDDITTLTVKAVIPNIVTEVEELELGDQTAWSNPASWRFDPPRLPQDGDRLVIESDMNIVLDLPPEEMPRLAYLEINGKLLFAYGEDRALYSYGIWVRGGELWIGTPEMPFDAQATIELLGDNTEEHWSFSSAVEAGNKNLVVTGNVHFHGTPRDVTSCRLQQTAYAKQDKIYVPYGLDWAPGERIGIAATNMRTIDYDECLIKEHDPLTGQITCSWDLKGYHYGSSASTESDWEVDMRAEVFLLDRNIRVQASLDDVNSALGEPWGCRILVSDFRETTGIKRTGSIEFDNVQVYNCS